MTSVRLFRFIVLTLLLTLLLVPALTQPARRLSTGPVNEGSSFSRVAVLSTDPLPAASHPQVAEVAAPVLVVTADRVVEPAPALRAVPPRTVYTLPPAPLRAPPHAILL